jgi:class 3 adenylate cyclase
MGLALDLKSEVGKIFADSWKRRTGKVVPAAEDVQLGNDAVELEAVVLYTDIVDSSGLVVGFKDWFAANVYKSFLSCACRIIRSEGGEITAFDGDRVMGVFLGDSMCTSAARTALKINWARLNIIQPEIDKKTTDFKLCHVTGIDVGKLFVARTGIRGSNDLVWVGKAANHSARLSSVRSGSYSSIISAAVYESLHESAKFGGDPKCCMWERISPNGITEQTYGSTWHWKVD